MADVEEIILKVSAQANLNALDKIKRLESTFGNIDNAIKNLNASGLADLQKNLKILQKTNDNTGDSFSGLSSKAEAGFKTIEQVMDDLPVRNLQQELENQKKAALKAFNEQKKAIVAQQKAVKDYQSKIAGLSKAMLQMSLTTLFFGMALKRLATSIIKSALTSFTKITYGAEGAGGALGALEVNFELLKYTLGAAIDTLLNAFLPTIIDVILAVSDWVEQNPNLAAGILLVAAAIGSIMVVLGTLGSALSGVISGFGLFAEGGQLASLAAGVSLTGILTTLGLIVAAVALLYVAWKTNFANIKDFVGKTLKSITDIFSNLFYFVIKTFGNVMDILEGIFTGDWNKVGSALVRILGDSLKLSQKIFLDFFAVVYNIGAFAFNALGKLLTSVLVDLPLSALSKLADVFGLTTIKSKIDEFKKFMDKNNQDNQITYTSGTDLYDKINSAEKNIFGTNADEVFTKMSNYGKDQLEETKTQTGVLQKVHDLLLGGANTPANSPAAQLTATTSQTSPVARSAAQLAQTLDGTSKVSLGFTTTLIDTNSQLTKSAEALLKFGMSTADMTAYLSKMMNDNTIKWSAQQAQIETALGIHQQGKINYQTGTVLGNETMRGMFGDYTAGLGQFQGGVSKIADYNAANTFANSRGGDYRGARPPNITVVNKNQNGGTYVTGASGTGTIDRST